MTLCLPRRGFIRRILKRRMRHPSKNCPIFWRVAGSLPSGKPGWIFIRNYAPREVQERAFRVHIRLACEMGLPLIIHSRAAETRVLDILEEEGRIESGRRNALFWRERGGSPSRG